MLEPDVSVCIGEDCCGPEARGGGWAAIVLADRDDAKLIDSAVSPGDGGVRFVVVVVVVLMMTVQGQAQVAPREKRKGKRKWKWKEEVSRFDDDRGGTRSRTRCYVGEIQARQRGRERAAQSVEIRGGSGEYVGNTNKRAVRWCLLLAACGWLRGRAVGCAAGGGGGGVRMWCAAASERLLSD